MSFLSPLSLILFLPLGAAVVVLYLLKLKRKEHVVSSVALWQDAVADIQANAPFQKLKKSLLLILQLAALLLLAAALARPYMRARGASENKIVLILDASASMQSADIAPSRFERAKSRALDIVSKMGPGDAVLVIAAGSKSRVVTSFTSEKKSLSAAISRLKPMDTACNMRQAMALALSLVAGRSAEAPRIVILSDGGFGALSELTARNARLDYIRIGRRCDNVAITGLDSRKTLSGSQQVFIGLRNFSAAERRFNLEILVNGQLADIREETLGPGQLKQEILSNTGKIGGRVTVKLDLDDDLAADNTGSVYLARRRNVNILMVSKGNVFLENALNLDPRARLVRSSAVPADLRSGKYDLVIFDGVQPPHSLPPGGYLLVGVSAPQGPAQDIGAVTRPVIIDWSKNHPVSAYVDFSNVRIARAGRLKPKEWAAPLVECGSGALAAAGANGGRRFVQLSFSLLDSDFPLHVGFPMFVANCLDWLVPPVDLGAGEAVRTGQPVYIDTPADVTKLTISRPDGGRRTIKLTQTPVIYDETEQAGIYHVHGKGINREFACNLASPTESDTTPKRVLTLGDKRFASGASSIYTNREYYGALIFVVLGLLVFEWYAYHRRL